MVSVAQLISDRHTQRRHFKWLPHFISEGVRILIPRQVLLKFPHVTTQCFHFLIYFHSDRQKDRQTDRLSVCHCY